jgi:hypothetical protein
MSVQRRSVLQRLGLDAAQVMLAETPEWGVVSFTAGLIRSFGKGVRPDATEEDGKGHAIVEDLTSSEKRRVARQARWVILPRSHAEAMRNTRPLT